MSAAQHQNQDSGVPAVCLSCRFGSGPLRDCHLIETGAFDRLIAEGPCKLDQTLLDAAEKLLQRQGRDPAAAQELRDGLLLRLSGRKAILSNLGIGRLQEFSNWLEMQLAAALDEVEDKALAPLNPNVEPAPPRAPSFSTVAPSAGTARRCGSCRHFQRVGGGRCGLEFIGTEAEALTPNPWWGQSLNRTTDPSQLKPSCEQYSAHAIGGLDPFVGLVDQQPKASRRDEAARVLCLALDRLAARGADQLAQASLFQSHLISGRKIAEIAATSGKSELELERLLVRARQGLNQILTQELAGGGPIEL